MLSNKKRTLILIMSILLIGLILLFSIILNSGPVGYTNAREFYYDHRDDLTAFIKNIQDDSTSISITRFNLFNNIFGFSVPLLCKFNYSINFHDSGDFVQFEFNTDQLFDIERMQKYNPNEIPIMQYYNDKYKNLGEFLTANNVEFGSILKRINFLKKYNLCSVSNLYNNSEITISIKCGSGIAFVTGKAKEFFEVPISHEVIKHIDGDWYYFVSHPVP